MEKFVTTVHSTQTGLLMVVPLLVFPTNADNPSAMLMLTSASCSHHNVMQDITLILALPPNPLVDLPSGLSLIKLDISPPLNLPGSNQLLVQMQDQLNLLESELSNTQQAMVKDAEMEFVRAPKSVMIPKETPMINQTDAVRAASCQAVVMVSLTVEKNVTEDLSALLNAQLEQVQAPIRQW